MLSLSGLTDHSLEIAGLCEFQGRELVVVDLAKCLGVPAQSGQATLVVAGVDVTSFGFMVQRVSAVQKYHQRNIRDGWLTGQGRRRRLIDWRALGIAAILRDFARCRS